MHKCDGAMPLSIQDARPDTLRGGSTEAGPARYRLVTILLVLCTVSWAAQSLIARGLYIAGFDPLTATTVLRLAAFVTVVGTVAARQPHLLRVRLADLPVLALYGAIAIALFSYLLMISIALVPVAIAVVLMYTGPVIMVIASVPLFGDRLTRARLMAVALAIGGCYLVSGGLDVRLAGLSVAGIVAGLGAGVCYAFLGLAGKIILRRVHGWTLMVYGLGFAVALLICFGGLRSPALTAAPPWAWLLVVVGASCFIPTYWVFLEALKLMSPGVVGVISTLEPVWTAVLAYVVFGELLLGWQMAGGAMVVGAVILIRAESLLMTERSLSGHNDIQ